MELVIHVTATPIRHNIDLLQLQARLENHLEGEGLLVDDVDIEEN